MNFLEKMWEDIRHGENIDQYATILLAFTLGVLGVFGIASAELISSLTLTVLGLLAISNLVNRRQIEVLSQKVLQSAESFFSDEFSPDFKGNFETAEEIWLIGVTLSRLLKSDYGKIEDKLRKGHSVKVLLVHPEGASLEMAASRYYADINRNAKTIGFEIKKSLNLFCGLQEIAPTKLEIRTIQNSLTFGGVCINPNSTTGILYLEHFPYRTASDALPKFILHASDGRWYDFFNKEIHALWNNSKIWTN